MQLATIQSVSSVVPGAVGDEGDEPGVVCFGFAGLCGESMEEEMDEVDVAHLVVPADVVDGTRSAPAQDGVDGVAVVFDVQPVADIEAVTVDGDGFTGQSFLDREGDEFLGVLAGTIVVGAAGDQGGHVIRPVVGLSHQVSGCLGDTVRTTGFDGRVFGKLLRTCQREVSIHLVGADVEEAGRAHTGVLLPLLAGNIQHDLGAQDVGAHKDVGAVDTAVHVGFGSKVDDQRGMILCEDCLHGGTVGDVSLHEGVAGIACDLFDIVRVAGIRQCVEVDEADTGILLHLLENETGADEATAPGDEDGLSHGTIPPDTEAGSRRGRPPRDAYHSVVQARTCGWPAPSRRAGVQVQGNPRCEWL